MSQSYRELIAWQKAMDYVMDIYKATSAFPRDEVYGLALKMRRGLIAIPRNIAQGQAQYSQASFTITWAARVEH
jgi:four helix bundle protein